MGLEQFRPRLEIPLAILAPCCWLGLRRGLVLHPTAANHPSDHGTHQTGELVAEVVSLAVQEQESQEQVCRTVLCIE